MQMIWSTIVTSSNVPGKSWWFTVLWSCILIWWEKRTDLYRVSNIFQFMIKLSSGLECTLILIDMIWYWYDIQFNSIIYLVSNYLAHKALIANKRLDVHFIKILRIIKVGALTYFIPALKKSTFCKSVLLVNIWFQQISILFNKSKFVKFSRFQCSWVGLIN